MAFNYDFPRPALTADCVVFGIDEDRQLKVLLIQRSHDPFAGTWALPGGFVEAGERLEDAALRELEEETGVKNLAIQQVYTFGDPGRDPRGWVVSVAHCALVEIAAHPATASSDARQVGWFPVERLPDLAFDHARVFEKAFAYLHTHMGEQLKEL